MRWNPLNSLFIKIFSSFWLLILLLTTVLILIPKLDSRQLQVVTPNDLKHIQNKQAHIRDILKQRGHFPPEHFLKSERRRGLRGIYFTDLNGRLVNERAPKAMRQFILDSQSTDVPLKKVLKRQTYIGPIAITHNKQQLRLYISFQNKKESLRLIEWLIDNPLLLLLAALLVSTPLCALLAWNLTKPLRQLQQATNKVAQGELDARFPIIKNSEEITQLASSIQQMVLSLKCMLNNQQRLLSDISHELRSPLTRLGLALAIHKKQAPDTKELQRIALEKDRIEQMIAQMLNLSRLQLRPDQKELLMLDEFLGEICLDAEFEAHENGKEFVYPKVKHTPISIYPEIAYRAIENIIRNAIKYAQNTITLEVSISKEDIVLTIKNDGQLIPENELENIFRPFYRLNEARDRETGGVGLGLSIAENAILKHGGKIWAENIDKQVCMHLQLPRFS